MTNWIVGIVCGIFALLGAFLAAGALDDGMFVFGLGLIVFGVWMIYFLIKKRYDELGADQTS